MAKKQKPKETENEPLLRINGRFVKREFSKFMRDLAKDAEYENPQKFINENVSTVKEFYDGGTFSRHKNENAVIDHIKDFNGKVYVNGELMGKGSASKEVAEFLQQMKELTGAAGTSMQIGYSKYGREMNITLPNLEQMESDGYSPDEILSELEADGFYGYTSGKKK